MHPDREDLLNLLSQNIEGGAKKRAKKKTNKKPNKKLNKGLLEYQKFVRQFKNKGIKRDILTKLYRRRNTQAGKEAIKKLKQKLKKKGYKIRGGMIEDSDYDDYDSEDDEDIEFGSGLLGGKKRTKAKKPKKSYSSLTPPMVKKFIELGRIVRTNINNIFEYRDKLEGGSIKELFSKFKEDEYNKLMKAAGKEIPIKKPTEKELILQFQNEFISDPDSFLEDINKFDYNLGLKVFKSYSGSVDNWTQDNKEEKKKKKRTIEDDLNLNFLFGKFPGQKPEALAKSRASKATKSGKVDE